jgi:hypothetical protein
LKRARKASSNGAGAVTLGEFTQFAHHDLLDVAAAAEGLAHAGGVHVELHLGRTSGQQVALEVVRDDHCEGEVARVHALVHLRP